MKKIEMEVKHDDLSREIMESLKSKLANSSYSIKLVVEYEEPVPDDWTINHISNFLFLLKNHNSERDLCLFVAEKVAQLEKERCIKEFKHYIDKYLCGEVVATEHLHSCLNWMETHNEFNYPRLKRDGNENY